MARHYVSDTQFFADQLDQLDLALDQVALRDRNFDRFAIMLIDNVVELALHRHATELGARRRPAIREDEHAGAIAAAMGQHFDPKVKLAKVKGVLGDGLADSILYLHTFRNTAHHSGQRHEGILHPLALYYFRCACAVLLSLKPFGWSSSSSDVIPHRAMKYLGAPPEKSIVGGYSAAMFRDAWQRVDSVVGAMGNTLVANLHEDMRKTIDNIDSAIQFIAKYSPDGLTRATAVAHSQASAFAWTEEGKAYARAHLPTSVKTMAEYFKWFEENYPWQVKGDPIPSWRKRLASLQIETDLAKALKKYCDFTTQTADLRDAIEASASGLSDYLDGD